MPHFLFSGIYRFVVPLLLLMAFTAGAQNRTLFNARRQQTMAQRWELDSASRQGTFIITPYKPVYVLPARWSSSPNEDPVSGNPSEEYDYDEQIDYNNIEARIQLSFKVKVLESIFWGYGDLWAAYTQKSQWQVYNKSLSRPFREINYEPEVILNFATNYQILGFTGRMAGISFNHTSNGKETPLSRSWNRVIFHAGFEKDNWQVLVRPWFRVRGEKKEDDNPDIEEYMGRGDLTLIYSAGRNSFAFTGSHNLNFNEHTKGYAELSWSYALKGNLKSFVQAGYGYGETMIDYNNSQFTIGVGVSLIEWL